MDNKLTEIVFILDRSSSMAGLEKDTIKGFNKLIKKQLKEPGRAVVSTVLFDNHSKVVHNRVAIEKIKPLTKEEYYVQGCTALLDALGSAIDHIEQVHRRSGKENLPGKTIFIINTDGMENASHLYTSTEIRRRIKLAKKKAGWEFIFLGANIDAVKTAADYGIDETMSVNFHCDSDGVKLNYMAIEKAICSVREGGSVSRDWKDEIDKDYNTRK